MWGGSEELRHEALSLLDSEKTPPHCTAIETGVGSGNGKDGLQEAEKEKGIPCGALGQNSPQEAALELCLKHGWDICPWKQRSR